MTKYTHPTIPFERRVLSASLQAYRAELPGVAVLQQLLAVLEANRWRALREMSEDLVTWRGYDRAVAVRAVSTGDEHAITLRSDADSAFGASIAHDQFANTIAFHLAEPLMTSRGTGAVERVVDELLAATPDVSWCTAGADPSVSWVALQGAVHPPRPFAINQWLQIVHPRIYTSFITRDALLAAPARVEERADGTIWIWTYDDPLRYDRDEAINAMKRLALYLATHGRRWTP